MTNEMNDLNIVIRALLDDSAKAIKNINSQIFKLQNDPKLRKLKIRADLDTDTLQKLTTQIETFQKQFSGSNRKGVHIVDVEQLKQESREVYTSFDEAYKKYSKLGTVKFNKSFDPVTKELRGFTFNIEKADGVVEKLKFDLLKIADQDKVLNNFELSSIQEVNKTNEIIEKQLRERQQINTTIDKQVQKEKETTLQLEHQLKLFKQQAAINIQNARRRYNGLVDDYELDKYLRQVNALTVDTPNAKKEMDRLSMGFRQIEVDAKTASGAIDIANKSSISFGDALKQAMVKFPIWIAASTAFFSTFRFFTNGISYVNELNMALTEISVVTGKTQREVNQLGLEYQKLAMDMGVLTKEIAQATVEFYRQGLTQEEVMKRTSTATQYAKISNMEFIESAEILTATTNSMEVSIERASDVFSYLGDATATGADEIGRAFQKVGGTAGALGVEFEKVASWIAVVSSRTRESAESIGTSFKTILARFTNLTEKGFDEEDGTRINNVAIALSKVGIELTNKTGDFRDFGQIVDELGAKWNNLDTRTQAYLATMVAGTRQQSRFYNLMEGYTESVKLYDQALDSAGTTQEKFSLWQEGSEAKLNRLKTAWTGVWQDTFNSEGIRNAIDGLTALVQAFDRLIEKFGLFKPILASIIISFMAFHKQANILTVTLGNNLIAKSGLLTSVFHKTQLSAGVLTTELYAINSAANATAFSFTRLKAAMMSLGTFAIGAVLPLAAIMAFSYALQKLIQHFQEVKEQEKQIKAQNDKLVESWNKNEDVISKNIAKYKELSTVKNKTTEQEQEYTDVQNELNELMPTLTDRIDDKGNAILKSVDAIEKEIQYVRDLKEEYANLTLENFEKNIDNALEKINTLNKQIEKLNKNKFEWQSASGNYSVSTTREDQILSDISIKSKQREIELLQQSLVSYTKERIRAYTDLEKITNVLTVADNEYIESLIENNREVIKSAEDATILASKYTDVAVKIANVRTAFGDLSNTMSIDEILEVADSGFTNTFAKVVDSISNGTDEWKQYAYELSKSGVSQELFNKILEIAQRKVGKLASDTNNLTQIIEDYQNGIADVSSAYQKLSDEQELSLDEIFKLVQAHPELISALQTENGQLTLNKDALEILMKAEEERFKQSLKLQQNEIQNQANALMVKLKNYGIEIEALDQLNEAKKKAFSNPYLQYSGAVELGKQFDDLEKYKKELDGLQTLINTDFTKQVTISSSTSSKSTSSKSKDTFNPYVVNEYANAIDRLDLQLRQSEGRMTSLSETSKAYRDELSLQINLYKQKQSLTHNEADRLRSENKQLEIRLNNEKLTIEQRNDLIEQLDKNKATLRDLSTAWWDYEDAIVSANKSIADSLQTVEDALKQQREEWLDHVQDIADDVVDAMKEAYQKQKELALATIDAEIEALENSHDLKMEMLDDELSKYEEIINAKLKEIDLEAEKEDYQKRLTNAQKEAQDIQNKINILTLAANSGDISAKAQIEDLSKQLADKQMEITEMQDDHTRDLRKQNLQDQLDVYREDVEAKKEVENAKYEKFKLRLEQERKDMEWHFNELLNDERYWASVRDEIIAGNIDNISTKLDSFLLDFESKNEKTVKTIGESWQELLNLIGQIESAQSSLGTVKNSNSSISDEASVIAKMKANSEEWKTASEQRRKELEEENRRWGASIGATYDSATGTWWKNNKRLYHKGGIINGNSSPIGDMLDKLLNTNADETVIKALKGEVFTPQHNFSRYFVPNLQKLIGNIGQPSITPVTVKFDNLLQIDNFNNKSETDINRLIDVATDRFFQRLKPYGFNIK